MEGRPAVAEDTGGVMPRRGRRIRGERSVELHLSEAARSDELANRLHDLGLDAFDLWEESSFHTDWRLAKDLVRPDHQPVERGFTPGIHSDLWVYSDETGPVLSFICATS